MLVSLAPVRAAVGGEDRSAADIRFLRVLAPEDRMKDWPLGGEKYLPIGSEEFERLVAAMKPRDSKTSSTPSAAIVAARYEAKLVGERLIGRAILDVTLAGAAPRLMPLAPCNFAIQKAVWDSREEEGSGVRGQGSDAPDLQISKSPNRTGPHPNPLPKGEGTAAHASFLAKGEETSRNNRAALGSGRDGRLGVFVDRSGRLVLEWSLAGHRDSSNVLTFSFEIPAAASNRLFVELPDTLAATIDRGLLLGSEAVDKQSRRWRIELGGNAHLRLQVAAAGNARPRRQLALLRESRTYDCSPRGLEVSAQWKLQVYNEPLDRATVLVDPGLQLVSARLGDVVIPWSAAPAADGGTRVTLRFPKPIRDTDRVVRLSALGRPVLDRPWRLPRLRAEGLLWLEGSISLLVPEPLAADRIVPLNCAQTGTGPLSAPRAGQSMQFQSFDRDATVEVSVSRSPVKVDMLAGAAIELDGQQATARVAAQFRIANDTQFAIDADVAPGWTIDSVESVPSGGVADWSAEPRRGGRQRLTIQLAAGLSPQQPVRITIVGRRPFTASGERLNIGDLPPLRFRGLAQCRQVIAVRPIGDYAMRVQGDKHLQRLKPDDLAPSESALLAAKLHDLLFERDEAADPLTVSLVAQEPQCAGSIPVDAAVGLSVEHRRLKAILPEPPSPGHVQTTRGACRYDPARDVAQGAKAAVRIDASNKPIMPSAWIGDCRLESWHQTDGRVRYSAAYDLENAGRSRLRLAMPPGIAAGELRGVRIDGAKAAWQVERSESSVVGTRRVPSVGKEEPPENAGNGTRRVPDTFVSIELPAHRKSLCVTVEWTAAGPPLGIVGSLAASMPEPDVPALMPHWTAWLPPGYESVGSDSCSYSADASTPDDTRGWTGRCMDVPLGTPVALRYARVASMQLFGAVVFLLSAGLGCWTARRRTTAVLAVLLGGFALAAMALPDAFVPVAWGGVFGIVFCFALRWAHRDRPASIPSIDASTPAADANPGSTVAAPIGSAMLGVLLALPFCGAGVSAARAGETPAPQGATTAPASSLPTVDGRVSAIARPASSPLYRVFVPVDARQRPMGGKVYVPEAFYQELYRRAAPVEKPPAWLILGAVYRGDLTKGAVSGRLTVSSLRAQYDLRVFDRATRVRIPLRSEGVNLLPGSVLLDGRAIEPEWEADGRALAFEVAEPGDYRLALSLRPAMHTAAGLGGFDMAIPRVAGSRVELALPADVPPVEVPSACGGVSVEKDPPRLRAELGPADRLTVRWQEAAEANGTRLAVNAEQLTWLKIQPGSIVVKVKFKFHVLEGEFRQAQLAVDSRLRLLPLPGDTPPVVQVGAESGQTRLITIRWPRPISDDVVLDAAFLFNGASAVGNIRLPRIELVDTPPTRRWMAVSVDPALDCEEHVGERLEAVAVADFLRAWGQCDAKPRAAYRLPRGEPGWTLATRPHEPRTTAKQTLSLSFDENRLDARFDARLSVVSGYVFQHQVTAPADFKIERVSLVADAADRVQRWSQGKDGTITVFLDGPVSGGERLLIRGRLPIKMGEKCELPLFAVQRCRIKTAAIQLFERPAVSLLWGAGVPPAGAEANTTRTRTDAGETPALLLAKTPDSERLVETIVWDGVRPPRMTVIARPRGTSGVTPRHAAKPQGGGKSSNVPGKDAGGRAARASAFIRLADVAIAWQPDGSWCGVAAFDIEPDGVQKLDLRLPTGCELIQASVEDVSAVPKQLGTVAWRLPLASSDSPQHVRVIYRCTLPRTDPSRLRFKPPTLGNLPVRQTLWTVFLSPSWTAENPQGAAQLSNRPRRLPCPSDFAAIGGALPPRYYLSEGGATTLTLDCRPASADWPFHRWAAAAVLALCGTASASLFVKGKRRRATSE